MEKKNDVPDVGWTSKETITLVMMLLMMGVGYYAYQDHNMEQFRSCEGIMIGIIWYRIECDLLDYLKKPDPPDEDEKPNYEDLM